MNKVVTINLGGTAYQLEEGGYDALRVYLETAGTRLRNNPDRDEILSDIERAIGEKFRAWSDCEGDVERVFSKDELLTNISLYWFTESATSAARVYKERFRSGGFAPRGRVQAPTACAIYPREMARQPIPRSWVERAYPNVPIYYNEVDKGGHFAAWEEPELFAEELRAAFRPLR